MDIERLNQTQVILLTLLVSFVTSIATGIATVSLMEKAPTDVTRVISRIVEKPIQTLAPGEREVITQERTVVVNEGEIVANAVAAIMPSIVRIYTADRDGAPEEFKGFGVVVSEEGVVVADARIVESRERYVARLSDGVLITAKPSDTASEQGLFALVPASGASLPALKPAAFEAFSELTLGQTVVAISGETSSRITPGVITELVPGGEDASRVRTTVESSLTALGSPLITLDGTVVGMPEELGSQVFVSLGE